MTTLRLQNQPIRNTLQNLRNSTQIPIFPIFGLIFSYSSGEGLRRPKPIFFIGFGPEARNIFCSRPTGLQWWGPSRWRSRRNFVSEAKIMSRHRPAQIRHIGNTLLGTFLDLSSQRHEPREARTLILKIRSCAARSDLKNTILADMITKSFPETIIYEIFVRSFSS